MLSFRSSLFGNLRGYIECHINTPFLNNRRKKHFGPQILWGTHGHNTKLSIAKTIAERIIKK